jgi:hypothetical protein
MPNHQNSAAFILTHGRPDTVVTYELLRRSGWTRPIYLIVDDEDETVPNYRKRYGEQVVMFSKEDIEKKFDIADTQTDRRTITYARNASFEIAESLGLDYHIQLDDDYRHFEYRYAQDGQLKTEPIKSMDSVFDVLAEFLDISNAHSIAMAQGGDLMGGVNSTRYRERVLRKAMNSFICRTDRPFTFIGRMNEDVNTYTTLGSRGALFFTVVDIDLVQTPTQSQSGGITELYKTFGTYTKSFYTVMMSPSFVRVSTMGTSHQRIHHNISWNKAVPKIISDRYRKTEAKQ